MVMNIGIDCSWQSQNVSHLDLEIIIDMALLESHRLVRSFNHPHLCIISRKRISDIVHAHVDDTMSTILKWCTSKNSVSVAEEALRMEVQHYINYLDRTIKFDYDSWYRDLLDWRVLSYIDELLYDKINPDNVYWWRRVKEDVWVFEDGGNYHEFVTKTGMR